MSRAPSQALEALQALSLLAQHSAEPGRGRFLAALRACGLREPWDAVVNPAAVLAWSRPDLLAGAFVAEVLDGLGAPERVAALEAIAALGERRSRASAGVAEGGTGDGPGGGEAL